MLKNDEKPWLRHYPQGVPSVIPELAYSSLIDMLLEQFHRYASQTAFSYFNREMSYAELEEHSLQFAAFLQQQGVSKGQRVAIMLPNISAFPLVFYGILFAGAVVVSINPLYSQREFLFQLHDADVSVLIISDQYLHRVKDHVEEFKGLKKIITVDLNDDLSLWQQLFTEYSLGQFAGKRKIRCKKHCISLQNTLKIGKQSIWNKPDIQTDDVAILQYTGGVSGYLKGAMLTHYSLLSHCLQNQIWLEQQCRETGKIALAVLPLYHIYCCSLHLFLMPIQGVHNILIPNPKNIRHIVRSFKRYPIAYMSGVSTLYDHLLDYPGFHRLNFRSLAWCTAGGMKLNRTTALRWKKTTGQTIVEGYGMTETSPVISSNRLDCESYTGHVGYPLPSTELQIRSSDGKILSFGEEGEIWMRGPQLMKGYWDHLKKHESCIDEKGWFDTGDIGYLSEEGELYLTDRKKDIIIVSGFNVYPNEVESVFLAHPAVAEVACVGVADEKTGEAVKVFIVLKKEMRRYREKELEAYAKTQLTAYKCPKQIVYTDQLPKNAIGKVLRRCLKK